MTYLARRPLPVRALCLLLIAFCLWCSLLIPHAQAVFLEGAVAYYGVEIIVTVLAAAGVVFASSEDGQRVGAAVYQALSDAGSSAIDKLRLLKDQRRYSLLEYSAENKTEYLGVRSSHGQVKLYNKALEQKTEGNLTRLEITLDYDLATWDEFRRLWPKCQVLGSGAPPGKLKDTDLVLYLACSERPEYLKMLGRDKRKKIEQLLATTAQYIEPCEESYKSILAQILYYGKDIRPEMWSDFIEVSDADEDVWIPKKFVPLTGTQEQL